MKRHVLRMSPSSGGAVDERYRCKHVNLVERSNVPGEFEYLFAPYSVSVAPYYKGPSS